MTMYIFIWLCMTFICMVHVHTSDKFTSLLPGNAGAITTLCFLWPVVVVFLFTYLIIKGVLTAFGWKVTTSMNQKDNEDSDSESEEPFS